MTIDAENNKKTEAIKASLVVLLNQLENRKQRIIAKKSYIYIDDKIAPYIPRDKLKLLNITTSILSKLIKQFNSVDDFSSVKKLRQTELFFLKNHELREFTFSSYKSQIDPTTLAHVNIEIKLDKLSKKANDLYRRGYHSEGIIANGVENELKKLNHWYFEKKIIDPDDYKTRALAIIDKARPILEKHRGCKQLLLNLILLISTIGTVFIINKAINGHFLFSPKTDSAKQLDEISQIITTAKNLSP